MSKVSKKRPSANPTPHRWEPQAAQNPTRVLTVDRVELLIVAGEWNQRELRFIAYEAAFDLIEQLGIVDAALEEPLKDWLAVCIKEFFDELLTKDLTKQQSVLVKEDVRQNGDALRLGLKRLYSGSVGVALEPFTKLENRCARDIKQLDAILARAAKHERVKPPGNASNRALARLSANIYDFCVPDSGSRRTAIRISQSSKLFAFANYIYSVVGHRCDHRMVKERLRQAAKSDAQRDTRTRVVRALFRRLHGKRFNIDDGSPTQVNTSKSRK